MEKQYWYAIMYSPDDNDWGSGSFDLSEAKSKVAWLRENGYPDAYIAVIDEGTPDNPANPICIKEIH